MYPGIQHMYPGIQLMYPGIQLMYPGIQLMYPGIQFISPGMSELHLIKYNLEPIDIREYLKYLSIYLRQTLYT